MEGYGVTGAWLHLGEHPFLHVIARAPEQTADTPALIDHFALEATDLPGLKARLEALGVPFRENAVPELRFRQIVIRDPDGVKVELNFQEPAA
jgi:hypothetical protein